MNDTQPIVITTETSEPIPDCTFSGGSATFISTEPKTEGE